jgi:FimV-like protein
MLNPCGIARGRINKLIAILFFAYLFFSCKAYAVGLGDLKVYSDLNQPLSVEIEIVGLKTLDVRSLRVSLASEADFALAGIARSFNLNKLKFEIVSTKDKSVIYIWTTDVVQDPFIEFLLDLEWPGGKIVKGFTILIDPQASADKVAARGIPLILSEEYKKSIQNIPSDGELKASFPYDAKLVEKLKSAEIVKGLDHTENNNNISQNNDRALHSSLTKSGDSLKELSDGFAVAEHEILIPAPLKITTKNNTEVSKDILLDSIIALVTQQFIVPEKLITTPLPPLAAKEVTKPVTVTEPVVFTVPAMQKQISQQVPMHAMPNTKNEKVVQEKNVKSIFNPLANKTQKLAEINEKQVASIVIRKYKTELIVAFLLVAISLFFIAKIIIQRQEHSKDDYTLDEIVEAPVKEPVPEQVVLPTVSEVKSPEPANSESTIEEIKIPEIPTEVIAPATSVENKEISMRLNLATKYIEAGDIDSAKDLLQELVKSSTGEEKAKAESLLNSVT